MHAVFEEPMAAHAFSSPSYYSPSRPAQNDTRDLISPITSPLMSRAGSVASDALSMVSGVTAILPNYLTHIKPAPEYMSHASASQVANEAQDAQRGRISDDEDASAERNGKAAVAESAVATVNAFLDKLLYDILATARSTSLLALRPAVTDVLKKNLARDAIATAEDNLEDLLALQDDDDSDDNGKATSPSASPRWNLEHIWKRSRLRVMMRSEKSEFDIDDDERYTQDEGLLTPERRFSQTASVISLSAEIFLAGVLDYIGEQLLTLAVIAASSRTRRRASISRATSGSGGTSHVLVEESDLEKAALNSAMDRLWRVWRKSLRARGLIPSRGRSASGGSRVDLTGSSSPTMIRSGSSGSIDTVAMARDKIPSVPDMHYPEYILASNIALPMTPRDVDEIAVPGLAKDPDTPSLAQNRTSKQEQLANGRPGSRTTWTAKHDYFYDPFRTTQEADAQRPTSQPTPLATPFVDAPGAWPAETPRPATSDSKEMTQLQKVRKLQDESILSHQEEMRTPTAERPGFRTSVVPTLDPSQLESDSEIDHSRSSSVIPPDFEEPDVKTPPAQKRQGRNIEFASGLSAAAIAAAMASISDSKQPGTLRQQQQPYGVPEQDERRKSLLDMKTLISGRDSAQEMDAPEEQVAVGAAAAEDYHRGSEESSRTNESYTLGNAIEAHKLSGPNIVQPADRHWISNLDSAAESDPTTPTEAPSSLLQPAEITSASSSRNAHRPPPLRLASSPLYNDDEGPRTAEKDHTSSPRGILALRKFSGAHASTSPSSPRSPRSPRELAKHIRSFSRQSSEDTEDPAQPIPIMRQRESLDSQRSRKASKIAALKNDLVASISMDEGGRPASSKLTSSSITSTEDFDMLVQSHDTVKYTLTPKSVRDMPTTASPYDRSIHSSSKSKLNESTENVASTGSRKPSQISVDTDVGNARISRSETKSPATSSLPKTKQKQLQEQRKVSRERRRSISRPAAQNVKSTTGGHLPREPTVQTQSTRDFADFIRSTGPDKEPDTFVPLLASRSSASLRSLAASQRSAQSPGAVSMSESKMVTEQVPPVPVMSDHARQSVSTTSGKSPSIGYGTSPATSYGKSPSIGYGKSPSLGPGKSPSIGPGASPSIGTRNGSLVAREANGSPSIGGSGDLIDFIRSGPDQPGERRIPKTIAPFRSSADNERPMYVGNGAQPATGRANGAGNSSFSSMNDSRTESTRDFNRDSTNSNSALLPNGSKNWQQTVQPAYSSKPAPVSKLNVPGGRSPAFGVERKRHRNKDPYPIDDSEDEDFLTALPRDKRSDQSLVDFLRQNEPPPNNAPAPLAVTGTAQARAMLNKARATSVNSLRTANAPKKDSPTTNGKAETLSLLSPISPISPLQPPSNGGARSSYENSIASANTSTSNSTMRPAQIMSRVSSGDNVPQIRKPALSGPKMEIRSAGNTKTARLGAKETTSTNDLADFLRSSGPPDEPRHAAAPSPVIGVRESKVKKSGMFWKKKTYMDMP